MIVLGFNVNWRRTVAVVFYAELSYDASSHVYYLVYPKEANALEGSTLRPGTVMWHDLTVENAEQVRDFYAAVVGWRPEPVQVHEHDDYNMMCGDDGQPTAGICHAVGELAHLPPQWLMYVVVEDIDASLERCREQGGQIISPAGGDGMGGKFAVISDPAGAFMALIQPA
jgi:uncharacterized protein